MQSLISNFFPSKKPPHSSTMKLKTLIKTLISSQFRRAVRSLSTAKSKTLRLIHDPIAKKRKKKNKVLFGSFRFHYNWCSSKRHSHVLPVPDPVFHGLHPDHAPDDYYDSTWHSTIESNAHESRLYGYLQWLEEKPRVQGKAFGGDAASGDEVDDIDKLADLFIANSHAKFILEKQESARRFKEMLERSA